jgi:hypothetical protein
MTQMPTPSWGLDRIDQRSLPTKGADPFFAYGDEPMHGVEYTLTVTDTQTGAVHVDADPFFAYGDGFLGGVPEARAGGYVQLQIMFAPHDPSAAVDGLVIVTPILDPAEIGLRYHAEFIYG